MYGTKYEKKHILISKSIVEKYPEHIKKGGCYTNIYDLITKEFDILLLVKENDMKICVGYIDTNTGYLARHMFIKDKYDLIIDPTLALIDALEETTYYPIKEYSLTEYIEALETEQFTALYNDTMTEALEFQKIAYLMNNMPCLG